MNKDKYLDQSKEKILNLFVDRYVAGQRDYLNVNEVYKLLDKKISSMRIRFSLLFLEELEYIEGRKFGKWNEYYRAFRINLDPESRGAVYYVSRRNNKLSQEKARLLDEQRNSKRT